MTTPNPRGFPRKSLEASICETLADGRPKSKQHWSWDPEEARRVARENKTGVPKARSSRVSKDTVDDAMKLLNSLLNEPKP